MFFSLHNDNAVRINSPVRLLFIRWIYQNKATVVDNFPQPTTILFLFFDFIQIHFIDYYYWKVQIILIIIEETSDDTYATHILVAIPRFII